MVVEGRSGQALNLAGEKLPEATVVGAVAEAAAAVLPRGVRGLREWAAREVTHAAGSEGDSAGHYCFYWELAGDEAAPGTATLAAWAAALDAALLRLAPSYARARDGPVSGVELKLVAPGAFEGVRWVLGGGGGWLGHPQLAGRRAVHTTHPTNRPAARCALSMQGACLRRGRHGGAVQAAGGGGQDGAAGAPRGAGAGHQREHEVKRRQRA